MLAFLLKLFKLFQLILCGLREHVDTGLNLLGDLMRVAEGRTTFVKAL